MNIKLLNEAENEIPNVGIKEFEPIKIDKSKLTPSYAKVKATFKQDLTMRDKSFKLDEVVAAQMTVEEEEKIAFETRVREEVAQKIEEMKDGIYSESEKRGFDAGFKKGYEEKTTEMNAILQDFRMMLGDIFMLRDKMAKENEDVLVKLVYLIAETIVSREIAKDPGLVSKTIKKVLEYSGAEEDIRVKISSRDYKAVEQIKAEIKETFGKIKNLSIEPDDSVENGGCIVETNYGEINANLPVRFNSVLKTLDIDLGNDTYFSEKK